VSLKQVFVVNIDDEALDEKEKFEYIFQKTDILIKKGQIRMFENIGSKVVWIVVDHIYQTENQSSFYIE